MDNGAMTAGSLAWGAVAQVIGVSLTLVAGLAGLAIIGLVSHLLKLPKGEAAPMPGVSPRTQPTPGSCSNGSRSSPVPSTVRQHRRVSKADADVQEEVLRCHKGKDRPVVRHFLTV